MYVLLATRVPTTSSTPRSLGVFALPLLGICSFFYSKMRETWIILALVVAGAVGSLVPQAQCVKPCALSSLRINQLLHTFTTKNGNRAGELEVASADRLLLGIATLPGEGSGF